MMTSNENGQNRTTFDRPLDQQSHKVNRTRISVTWVLSLIFLVLFLALTIFIIQNSQSVSVTFLGLQGSLPLAAALFLATITGGVMVALAGGARVIQLRRLAGGKYDKQNE